MRGSSDGFLHPVISMDVFGKKAMAGSHGFSPLAVLRSCQETDSSLAVSLYSRR